MQNTTGVRRLVPAWWLAAAIAVSPLAGQPQSALRLNNQAAAAGSRGDYQHAEQLYRDSLQKWSELGHAYDAHRAGTLVNLGQMLASEGKTQEGISALEDALALHRSSLGAKNLRTVRNLSLLGQAYVAAGDLNRAETDLTEALAVEREFYPADALLAGTLHGLSVMHRLRGDLDAALQFGEESLKAAIQTGGDFGTTAAVAYENVAVIHRLAGRPERALPLFRKARFIYEQKGGGSAMAASLLSQEGMALLESGEPDQAEQEMSQAVNALAKMGPACGSLLAAAESNLGLLRVRQKKFADAERLLTHALSIQESMAPPPEFDMAATLENLAELRKAQRRNSESAMLLNRAAGLKSNR